MHIVKAKFLRRKRKKINIRKSRATSSSIHSCYAYFKHSDWLKFFDQPIRMLQTGISYSCTGNFHFMTGPTGLFFILPLSFHKHRLQVTVKCYLTSIRYSDLNTRPLHHGSCPSQVLKPLSSPKSL